MTLWIAAAILYGIAAGVISVMYSREREARIEAERQRDDAIKLWEGAMQIASESRNKVIQGAWLVPPSSGIQH
jgi:hypothetical protein